MADYLTVVGQTTPTLLLKASTMSVDDSGDELHIKGLGKTEIVVGLTEDRTEMFFGLQGRQGEIGCAKAVKKEVRKISDWIADTHYLMKGPP